MRAAAHVPHAPPLAPHTPAPSPSSRRCVATYLSPLAEKSDKDEYASSGYLTSSERTRLLSEWAPRPSIKAQLEQEVGPEMDKLHKARQECAASPKDQRYMPATLLEAQELGGLDAEAARKVATTRSRYASPLDSRPTKPRLTVSRVPPATRRTKLAASCASPKGVTKKRRRSHA